MHVKDIKIFLKKKKIKSKVNKNELQSHSRRFQFLAIKINRNAAFLGQPETFDKKYFEYFYQAMQWEIQFSTTFFEIQKFLKFFLTGSGCTTAFLSTCLDIFTVRANVKLAWHLKCFSSQYMKSHREEKECLMTIKTRVTDF